MGTHASRDHRQVQKRLDARVLGLADRRHGVHTVKCGGAHPLRHALRVRPVLRARLLFRRRMLMGTITTTTMITRTPS